MKLIAMSIAATNPGREAIRLMLVARAGKAPDASATAKATADMWRLVTSQLAPVIGAAGVEVLLARAVHQASAVFPWIALDEDDRSGVALLASLQARLAAQVRAAAEDASTTIFLNFAELLSTLIGESLTERLLAPVWAIALPAFERETS